MYGSLRKFSQITQNKCYNLKKVFFFALKQSLIFMYRWQVNVREIDENFRYLCHKITCNCPNIDQNLCRLFNLWTNRTIYCKKTDNPTNIQPSFFFTYLVKQRLNPRTTKLDGPHSEDTCQIWIIKTRPNSWDPNYTPGVDFLDHKFLSSKNSG